jgi:hypothetical protein
VSSPKYSDSVFINCPFDPEYSELFPALVFAVHDCGFIARSALEESDSGETRIQKLYRIIKGSKYGIHDISRTQLNKHRLPRFNMPLELGIFLGATQYGADQQRAKACLILDRDAYRYQKFCSDLSGNEPKSHKNQPRKAVIVVRNWLRSTKGGGTLLPGGEKICKRYRAFKNDLPILCASFHLKHNALEFNDLTTMVDEWLKLHPL